MNEERIQPATENVLNIHHPTERLRPSSDLFEYLRHYVRERPEVVALWCIGIGFAVGWKLKP